MSTASRARHARFTRAVSVVTLAGTALVFAVALAPAALAQTPGPPDPNDHPHPHALTAAQRDCLTQHGVSVPTPPSNGQHPTPPSASQRQAFEAAAKACGLPLGHGPHRRVALTAAQRDCLTQHGVSLPTPPSNGQHPTPPSASQRQAFEAAAQACGITLPKRPA